MKESEKEREREREERERMRRLKRVCVLNREKERMVSV